MFAAGVKIWTGADAGKGETEWRGGLFTAGEGSEILYRGCDLAKQTPSRHQKRLSATVTVSPGRTWKFSPPRLANRLASTRKI